jgi:hypothetical protein
MFRRHLLLALTLGAVAGTAWWMGRLEGRRSLPAAGDAGKVSSRAPLRPGPRAEWPPPSAESPPPRRRGHLPPPRLRAAPAATEPPTRTLASAAEESMPLSPEVVAREARLRQTLESLRREHGAVEVAFTNCEGGDCLARITARDPAAVDRFVEDARRSFLELAGRPRERLTAFNGRFFEADLSPAAGHR